MPKPRPKKPTPPLTQEEEEEEEEEMQREEESNKDQDFASGPRPSKVPRTRRGKAAPPPTAPGRGNTQPLATPPTTRKRGCSSLETSAPAPKRGTSRLASTEEEEEEDNNNEEEAEEDEEDEDEEDEEDEEENNNEDEEEQENNNEEDEDEDDGGWHGREEESIKPAPLRFLPVRPPGPTCDPSTAWTPISLFRLFFSDTVVQQIIDSTNANAAKRKAAGATLEWEALTMKDFYTFLGITIFSGLVRLNHRSDYWSKEWPYNFHFPVDRMARRRFEAILRSLHLSDPEEDEENEQKRHTAEHDLLFQIKPLYTQMVDACKANFQPHQNLSINERMVGRKVRNMKRDLDTPTKRGYKLLVLADSSTGYTWNFSVSSGRSESSTGRRSSAVMDLLPFPLLGDGYVLYTHSSYSSPALFADLSKKNMGCCGTLRGNVPGFPKTRTNDLPRKPERGDMRWLRRGELLFVKWKDLREVFMCSTVHQAYSGQTVKRKVKAAGKWQSKAVPVPDSIVDYNPNMGGVDLSAALIGTYSVHHKTTEWFKTLFYHFVDIAVVNSFLLHKELSKLRTDTKTLTHKAFREQLAMEMLESAEGSLSDPRPRPPPHTICMPMFFDCEEAIVRKYCKRCQGAGLMRMKTSMYCRKCQVPLCFTSKKNCFLLWHEGLTS